MARGRQTPSLQNGLEYRPLSPSASERPRPDPQSAHNPQRIATEKETPSPLSRGSETKLTFSEEEGGGGGGGLGNVPGGAYVKASNKTNPSSPSSEISCPGRTAPHFPGLSDFLLLPPSPRIRITDKERTQIGTAVFSTTLPPLIVTRNSVPASETDL